MKLHFTSALVAATMLAAIPAYAAGAHDGSAVTRYGQSTATDCFKAAGIVSRGTTLSDPARNSALTSCADALAEKISDKDRVATLVNRGTIEAASGDTNSALADYDAALALNPNMGDVYVNRGTTLMRAARYEEARGDFDKALTLGVSNRSIAFFDRGMAQEKSGHIAAAYQDYKQAVALAPDFQPARAELSRFQTVPRTANQG